ncbi:hypothetical protein CHLNCDRAFT_140443 [Chlorella variabilis]|uniref:DNA polymerase kappa n=1 Tax=Chlorella variabilis TaxID=554065 RepID=E1Z5E1_CHLVA|nr:hypothetical protein CHLNCDRAFT_140443 [Chlorella variabilis]EFN58744.1 hypothetical protein CHLNCDRAFT_140443 [Chlorella variabilis]|eukprot:XP_005850846.1 hypothetical protein CHLNCDRAFT_140443 [Chlorella variabilis]
MAAPQQGQGTGGAPPAYETVFTNAKAGMEGVDVEKGSAHYENEQRKERAHEDHIARMRAAAAALGPTDLARCTAAMDAQLAALEAGRDLSRTWLHVDMDAFFAAVEELERPELRGRAFAVGGMGMISTASYAARRFGVRSAMPGFIALKLCPDLVFVAPDFAKYTAASQRVRAILRDYDPGLQPGSLDEAALDATDCCAARGLGGGQVAAEIRRRVQQDTGLTCSVGIAPNRMLAKICSDRNKPNGQFELEPRREAVMDFMRDLSIRKVPGVGKVTQKYLAAFEVQTCGDLLTHKGLLQLRTRAQTLPRHISAADDLFAAARRLLLAELPCELRLLGLRVSGFLQAPRRAPGQLSLEQALGRRQQEEGCGQQQEQQQRQQRQQEEEEGGAGQRGSAAAAGSGRADGGRQGAGGSHGGGGHVGGEEVEAEVAEEEEEGGVVHSSQALGEGELLELSLREWQAQESSLELSLREWQAQGSGEGGDGGDGGDGGGGGAYSLPPSLLASPATAERFEREAAATEGRAAPAEGEGGLDMMLQQAAGRLAASPALREGQAAEGSPGQQAAAPADEQQQVEREEQQQEQQQEQQEEQAEQEQALPAAAPQHHQQGPPWTCKACTFHNPRAAFWCEVCGTSRLGARCEAAAGQAAAAGAGAAAPAASKGSASGGKAGAGSSGKAKRGSRKAAAAAASAAAPSILRFMSARQPSPPAGQQPQQPQPAAAAQEEARAGGGEGQQPQQEPRHNHQQQQEQQEEQEAQPAGSLEVDEYEDDDEDVPPGSPLLPGEDVMECTVCGEWVRETRLQAHEDAHLAAKLQQEEDKLGRLFANAGNTAPGAGSRKKRAAGGNAGSRGGRQGTLLTAFKRPKQ